ncbi:MAG: haloacid dehalogenase type II [Tepidisphaera sp.]
MLDLHRIEALTFDCFGTLIDWEAGILQAVKPVLSVHGVRAGDDEILGLFALLEREQEAAATADRATAFVCYKDVLRNVMMGIGEHFGKAFVDREVERLPQSLARWPAFADTAPVLAALSGRYRLAVLSNVDGDLFEAVLPKLGAPLAEVVTAEACRSYKPDPRHFRVGLALLDLPAERVLHVAESVVHDVVPATEMGMPTAWINRRGPRGFGASGAPVTDVPKPTFEVPSLRALAEALGVEVG